LTEHTGVTREARSLSGSDIGRLYVEDNGACWVIVHIQHDPGQTIITMHNGNQEREHGRVLDPTDTVTIKGRDE
jgi:hypothetical protein